MGPIIPNGYMSTSKPPPQITSLCYVFISNVTAWSPEGVVFMLVTRTPNPDDNDGYKRCNEKSNDGVMGQLVKNVFQRCVSTLNLSQRQRQSTLFT